MLGNVVFGLFGLAVLISLAYAFSHHKASVDWRQVAAGVGLQVVFAVVVILVPGGREFFDAISRVFEKRYLQDKKNKGGNRFANSLLGETCPDCGETISFEEGCMTCHFCGFTKCG